MTPKQLQQIRAFTDLSPKAFGEKLGYSRPSIVMKESGQRGIKPPFIKLVQKIFKKAFDNVMG